MLAKKEMVENQQAERDIVDFIMDASKTTSRLAKRFCEELNKEGATADDLHQFLLREGYEGVSREDCTMLLHWLPAQRPTLPDSMPAKAY